MFRRVQQLILCLTLTVSPGWSQTAAVAQEPSPSPDTIAVDTGTTSGASGDNAALAVATKDGASTFTVSFRIVRTSSDTVDETNIAFAFASCEACEAVAIAVQVVLVGSSPSTVIPENYAIALNFECVDCQTLASAYQFVQGTDGNVHFSPEGNRALAEIRRQLETLRRSDLSIGEIQTELDALADQLRTVLADELLASGPEGVQVDQVQDQNTVEAPAATPSPATSTSPSVTSSPSPTESTSPTPEPSTSPAESPSPTMSSSPAASPSPAVTSSP